MAADSERWFLCEDCGYELPESELCCGDYRSDGQITDGHCKACDSRSGAHVGHHVHDGMPVGGGTFLRCE